ncbi:hypothetical protein KCP74_15830 [Salmonella enterica subsp. enterica]|nr:hypothetical protein KCP74_15830 [Salmonella enterica subsp. enterica]
MLVCRRNYFGELKCMQENISSNTTPGDLYIADDAREASSGRCWSQVLGNLRW